MKEFFKKNFNKKTVALLFVLIISFASVFVVNKMTEIDEMKYTKFIEMVKEDKVEKIDLRGDASKMIVYLTEKEKYVVENPKTETFKEEMLLNGIKVDNKIPSSKKVLSIVSLVFNFGLILILVIIMYKYMAPTLKKGSNLVMQRPNVKFKDIAGNEEAKEDMKHLVEFLKDDKKYKKIGAKLPKGVILFGPPGTGKTLMAKAVAGEASIPFFYISGSDFVEMFVGLGAKRVRNLFEEAKAVAPAIIFIDEIDAIGKKRGQFGNTSEHDQTINAILEEMDGFSTDESVIVIAATNQLDSLDNALIRPGRFDRHVKIDLPDFEDRKNILQLYSNTKEIDKNVELESLARITIGFSGASLEALMNEAAIIAVNNGSESIRLEDIDEAYFKVAMKGSMKKNKSTDVDEIKLVAYHEAGHTLITKLLTDNHLHKVTIIPSTSGAGGATFTVPKKMSLISKRAILNNIKVLYAGRAAEEILLGDKDAITSGASGDIQQATSYIKSYFSELGMGDNFGMISLPDEKVYIQDAIELSRKLYDETLELLKENRDLLDSLSEELIKKETLSEDEINEVLNM